MSINKGQAKGRVEEGKGSIKEATGELVGDETLETKGNIRRTSAKFKPSSVTSNETWKIPRNRAMLQPIFNCGQKVSLGRACLPESFK